MSADECKICIALHQKYFPTFGKFHRSTRVLPLTPIIGLNDNSDIDFLKHIYSRITAHIYEKDSNTFVNYFEIVEWPVNAFQETHLDISYHTYTSIIYLNDDFFGGETRVGHHEINPERGKILTFTGNQIEHSVNEIKKFTRYTMPVWYKTIQRPYEHLI